MITKQYIIILPFLIDEAFFSFDFYYRFEWTLNTPLYPLYLLLPTATCISVWIPFLASIFKIPTLSNGSCGTLCNYIINNGYLFKILDLTMKKKKFQLLFYFLVNKYWTISPNSIALLRMINQYCKLLIFI